MNQSAMGDGCSGALVRSDGGWVVSASACMWTIVQHEPMPARAWLHLHDRWRREACDMLPIAPARAQWALARVARDRTLACAADRDVFASIDGGVAGFRPATPPPHVLAALGAGPDAGERENRAVQRAIAALEFLPHTPSPPASAPLPLLARAWKLLAARGPWIIAGATLWLGVTGTLRAWAAYAQYEAELARLTLAHSGSMDTSVPRADIAPACALAELLAALACLDGRAAPSGAIMPAGALRGMIVDASGVHARVTDALHTPRTTGPSGDALRRFKLAGWQVKESTGCEHTLHRPLAATPSPSAADEPSAHPSDRTPTLHGATR